MGSVERTAGCVERPGGQRDPKRGQGASDEVPPREERALTREQRL